MLISRAPIVIAYILTHAHDFIRRCNSTLIHYCAFLSQSVYPCFLIKKYETSVKAFNVLYYHRAKAGISQQTVDIDTFSIRSTPSAAGTAFTVKTVSRSTSSFCPKRRVFRCSKRYSRRSPIRERGKTNGNYLSFPMEGYSLALNFKIEEGLFELLDRLDGIVLKYNGRIYLTKDMRVGKATFEQGYPQIEKFRELRKTYGMESQFYSLQSKRVGI
jgi:decaprenylphospho-beta-D-ribofuranose 2-oxidase